MPQADEISLRPRLTICKDLHPELFEIFNRTPVNRHNALVMQMLIRMATIDVYGAMHTHRESRSTQGLPTPPAPLPPPARAEKKPSTKTAQPTINDSQKSQADEIDTAALINATGAMFLN